MGSQSYPINATFDPLVQPFIVLAPDGITPVIVSMNTLHHVLLNIIYQAIGGGVQIGVAAMTIICLLIFTETGKRTSWVFLCNLAMLLICLVRGIFMCLEQTGPTANWYRMAVNYYEGSSAIGKVTGIGVEVLTWLLVAAIEAALVLQVYILCKNAPVIWQRKFLIYSAEALAFVATACRFALMVINLKWNILGVSQETPWQYKIINELAEACNAVLVASIGYSAIVFSGKLIGLIRFRRSALLVRKFDALGVILIMGCQSMVAPLVFTIVAYYGVKNAQMQSFVPCVIAITLPISALWSANTKLNKVDNVNPVSHENRLIPVGASNDRDARAYVGNGTGVMSTLNTSDTLVDEDIQALTTTPTSLTATTPKTTSSRHHSESDSDLEMGRLDNQVRVDRSYGVGST